ncbi:MAG: polysaccharide biosynthesis/export family protein [Myxococcales bacterium]|nr:polysaccharide biosynthesis/export family protein [Myxococcales bacterium]
MANQYSCQIGVQSRAAQRGRILRGATAMIAGAVAAAGLGCVTPGAPSPVVETVSPYRVGAPDSLTISILPEPTIEAAVQVRPDGMITVPLIGEVVAGGRTIPEIAAEIEERIARFKRDPHVSVALTAAASTDIVILGEVGRQASFPLVKETRIIEAIGMVGGTTAFSSDSRIRVIRTVNGVTKVMRVNLQAIRKGDLSTNLMLEPGDFVYVPPTLWARFGYLLNTLLFPFQPVMGMARTMGGNLLTP